MTEVVLTKTGRNEESVCLMSDVEGDLVSINDLRLRFCKNIERNELPYIKSDWNLELIGI